MEALGGMDVAAAAGLTPRNGFTSLTVSALDFMPPAWTVGASRWASEMIRRPDSESTRRVASASLRSHRERLASGARLQSIRGRTV